MRNIFLRSTSLALIVAASPAFASDAALDYSDLIQQAAVRVFNPLGPQQISGGGHAFGPSGYVQPALTTPFALAYGDSRTANSGGIPYGAAVCSSNCAFTTSANYSNGYAGWLYPISGNFYLPEAGWNYGVGAQTTAGILGRMNSTTPDCNGGDVVAGVIPECFTGSYAAPSATISPNPSSPVAVTFGTFAGPAASPSVGDYVGAGAGVDYGCRVSAVSGQVVTLPTGCVTASITTATKVAFSPAARSSAFAAYLGASGAGATVTDVANNKIAGGAYFGGAYSVVSDPAQVVFALGGTNDGSLTLSTTQYQSIANWIGIFNALGPSGANKILIVGDELPRGMATGWSVGEATFDGSPEVATLASTSYTAVKAASYYDTEQVLYAPAGTGAAPFVAGTNDGVALQNCSTLSYGANATIGAPSGAAACTPGPGQYSVSAAGVYTFNTAQVGAKIAIYYRWANNGSGVYLTTLHNWFDSTSCGSFTDPNSGVTYPVSGAQCPGLYPWVHVAATWAAVVDSASGSNYYPKAYALVDGLHPVPFGGASVAKAMLNAVPAGALPASAAISPPTVNNFFAYGTATTTTAQTSTCGAATGATTKNYFLTALTPAASSGLYSAGQTLYFSNSGLSGIAGAVVNCVDTANNALQMSMAAPANVGGSTSNYMQVRNDASSLLIDGVFDAAAAHGQMNSATGALTNAGTLTASAGGVGATVTKAIPYGWTLATDSGSTTALAAGTLGVAYGIEQNPFGDGYDDFIVQLQGYAGTGSPAVTLTNQVINGVLAGYAVGDKHRMICEVKISAGPNGHLYGLSGAAMKYYDQTTGTFAAPGSSANLPGDAAFNNWTAMQGGGAVAFNDASLTTGAPNVAATSLGNVLTLQQVTPPAQVGAAGTFSAQASLYLSFAASDPVSATVRLRRCAMSKVAR